MLKLLGLGFVLLLALTPTIASAEVAHPAKGGVGCQRRSVVVGLCTVEVRTGQGERGTNEPISAKPGRNGSTNARTCSYLGLTLSCESPSGHWSNSTSDYCRPAANPPPTSDPIWGGHTSGGIYACSRSTHPGLADPGDTVLRWFAGPPELAPPNPEELARRLLATIEFQAPELGIQPRGDSAQHMGYAGWHTWLWVKPSSSTQWGPITDSISEGGVTVTLTAMVEGVSWDMGDGETVRCGKGTPWTGSATGGRNVASPDCGHVYASDGNYAVTATSHWAVEWRGGGRSGALPFTLSRSARVLVGELQTVVTQR